MEEFNIEQIENYLSDLDNLVDTGHFSEISVERYTHHHKEMHLKQFIGKGREIIRQATMKEKEMLPV